MGVIDPIKIITVLITTSFFTYVKYGSLNLWTKRLIHGSFFFFCYSTQTSRECLKLKLFEPMYLETVTDSVD